jgi:hypothetical protein
LIFYKKCCIIIIEGNGNVLQRVLGKSRMAWFSRSGALWSEYAKPIGVKERKDENV